MGTSTNIYEQAGRARKVSALLVQCMRDGLDLADVALFSDAEWAGLAERAGVKVPSKVTRAALVTQLERRGDPAPSDPFVGVG